MITPQAIETYPANTPLAIQQLIRDRLLAPQSHRLPRPISASGQLIFANQFAPSGSIASQKRLNEILFHCDNSLHKYTLTLKVNGSLLFSSSGTFSRTIEVS